MTKHTVSYGSRRIEFRLERRAVRSLAISVLPTGAVKVIAPLEAEDSRVEERIVKRGKWIVRQWERQAAYLPKPPPRQHHTGESVRYLGRQYRLRVLPLEPTHRRNVVMNRTTLEIRLPKPTDASAIARALDLWFKEKAQTVLRQRFDRCSAAAKPHGLRAGKLELRFMSKRWGSCVRERGILLNPELVKAPLDCIDYVILHEICHRKFHCHSSQFYALLSSVLPDWSRLKAKLERCEI